MDGPISDVDLFTDESLCDPYPYYEQLREHGGAVWLSRLGVYALPRYAEVRQVARDWEHYSSAQGVFLNDAVNAMTGGVVTLCTDGGLHEQMRQVLRRPLTAEAVRELAPRLAAEAESLVERLVERGRFDAVSDFARHLPLSVISDLVGVPEEGRERMLEWAFASFDSQGPMNERTRAALVTAREMVEYGNLHAVPPHLKPGGWAQQLYDAADRGELPRERCPMMMPDYLGPSLDTTINGIASAIMLLGEHPDQWDLLRADPSRIPGAVNEALRLESPIQRFSRVVTEEQELDGVRLPAGARVMLLFGSANRDERRWSDPTRFDVRRERVAEHLAFGFGPHACVGSALARLEMRVLLEALVARVARFAIAKPVRAINQTLRGLAALEVTLVA